MSAAQSKAEKQREKAGRDAAKKLDAACDALHAFMRACNACDDASAVRGADDSRILLIRSMAEYGRYLEGRFDRVTP